MKPMAILNRLTTGRALLLGLASGCLYYFLLFDSGSVQQGQIAAMSSRLQELTTQIAEAQKKLDRAAVFQKNAAEVGSKINKLLAMVPEKFNMPDLMRLVSNEAKVAGSSLSTLTPNTSALSTVAKEFDELSVSVDLTGTFLQHMIFLSNLTKVPQILVLRKVDFTIARDAKIDESAQVKMLAEIVAFRYRPPEKVEKPADGSAPPVGGQGK